MKRFLLASLATKLMMILTFLSLGQIAAAKAPASAPKVDAYKALKIAARATMVGHVFTTKLDIKKDGPKLMAFVLDFDSAANPRREELMGNALDRDLVVYQPAALRKDAEKLLKDQYSLPSAKGNLGLPSLINRFNYGFTEVATEIAPGATEEKKYFVFVSEKGNLLKFQIPSILNLRTINLFSLVDPTTKSSYAVAIRVLNAHEERFAIALRKADPKSAGFDALKTLPVEEFSKTASAEEIYRNLVWQTLGHLEGFSLNQFFSRSRAYSKGFDDLWNTDDGNYSQVKIISLYEEFLVSLSQSLAPHLRPSELALIKRVMMDLLEDARADNRHPTPAKNPPEIFVEHFAEQRIAGAEQSK